nr:MAG TPA: hypothetical protein [Inoviridae sp.]
MPRGLCLAVFFSRDPAVAPHGQGCAVGGARWCYGMRAVFRRDYRGCSWLLAHQRAARRE